MPKDYRRQLEAILFIQAKPVTLAKLAKWLGCSVDETSAAVTALTAEYNERKAGLRVVSSNNEVQLTTAGDLHEVVAQVIKDERTGELTKPSLETLAIIAYRSPVTKAELEAIRGVNCSLILRNLLIRGLICEIHDRRLGIEVYDITPEYLQLLGVSSVRELPDYEQLHRDIKIGERLALLEKPGDFFRNEVAVEPISEITGEPTEQTNEPADELNPISTEAD